MCASSLIGLISASTYAIGNNPLKDKYAFIDSYWLFSSAELPKSPEITIKYKRFNVDEYIELGQGIRLFYLKNPILEGRLVSRLYSSEKSTAIACRSETPKRTLLYMEAESGQDMLAGFRGKDLRVYRLNNDRINSVIIQQALGIKIEDMHRISQTPSTLPPQRNYQNKLDLRLESVTDEGLKEILAKRKAENITEIDLYAANITDESLKLLAKECPNLKVLDLGMCTNITDDGVAHLRSVANLTELNLCCPSKQKVTVAGLVHLHGLLKLSKLNVGFLIPVRKDLEELLAECPALDKLTVCSKQHTPRAKITQYVESI